MTATDRAAHRYAITTMAVIGGMAFCIGALFALIVGALA